MSIRIALLSTLLAATAVPAAALSPARLAALTPQAVAERTQVVDDKLEFETVISTEPVARSRQGLFEMEFHDNHLRAIVDKATGNVRFEVHHAIQYSGARLYGSLRNYRQAHFVGADGLDGVKTTRVSETTINCVMPDISESRLVTNVFACPVREDVAFTVDEATLRAVAAQYRPGATWDVKLKAEQGQERLAGVPQAEVAGLLKVVDRYRQPAPKPLAQAGFASDTRFN